MWFCQVGLAQFKQSPDESGTMVVITFAMQKRTPHWAEREKNRQSVPIRSKILRTLSNLPK